MHNKKDRNGMDLTETEDIKKRWQEYTEKLYSYHVEQNISQTPESIYLLIPIIWKSEIAESNGDRNQDGGCLWSWD